MVLGSLNSFLSFLPLGPIRPLCRLDHLSIAYKMEIAVPLYSQALGTLPRCPPHSEWSPPQAVLLPPAPSFSPRDHSLHPTSPLAP